MFLSLFTLKDETVTSSQAATVDDAGWAQDSRSRGSIVVVLAVVFIDLVGFGIIIPILPFYVRSFGLSDVFIGLLAASYSFAQFVAAPALGQLSDVYGRRPVLMFSVGVAGIAWLIFGLAAEIGSVAGTTAAVVTLFGARIIAGAAGGNIATAQAYIADVTAPEDRASGLGLIGAAFGLGFVFGPAIGGVAASETVVTFADGVLPAFVPATEFSIPSFTAAVLSFLALATAALFLKEPTRTKSPTRRVTFVGQFREALRDATIRPLVIAFFLVAFAFAGVVVMFVPYLADFFGYDATQAAIFLTYIGVLGVINQGILVGRLSKIYGARKLVSAGTVSLFIAFLLLAFAPTFGSAIPIPGPVPWLTGELAMLVVFGAFASFGNGAVTVGLSTLVSQSTSEARQGTAFGVTQAAGSLGRTVGPPLAAAGYVLVYWSPFVAGAVMLIPIALILSKRQ